jgi:hypothetical protein
LLLPAAFALAILAAVLAADATTASSEQFGDALAAEQKRINDTRLESIRRVRRSTVIRFRPRDVATQLLGSVVSASIVAGTLFALLWSTTDFVGDLLRASIFVAAVSVASAITLTLAHAAAVFRNALFAIYLRGVWGAMVLTATIWAFVAILYASTPSDSSTPGGLGDWAARFAAPILLMFLWLSQGLLLSGRIPISNEKLAAGIGYQIVTRIVERHLRKDSTAVASGGNWRPSARSVATLITAFILPPVGALASHFQLRTPARRPTRITLWLALVVAYAIIAVLLATLLVQIAS